MSDMMMPPPDAAAVPADMAPMPEMAAPEMAAPPVEPAAPMIPMGEPPVEPPIAPSPMGAEGALDWKTFFRNGKNNAKPKWGPGFSYAYRPITGISGSLSESQRAEVMRGIRRTGFTDPSAPAEHYTGSYLVDGEGRVARSQYDLQDDTYKIVYSIPSTRMSVIKQMMNSAGMYGEVQPRPNVVSKEDHAAFRTLLSEANRQGVTWDVALARVLRSGGTFTHSGGNNWRDPTPEDPFDYLRQSMRQVLGRQLTTEDVDRMIGSLVGSEAPGAPAPVPPAPVLPPQGAQEAPPVDERANGFVGAVDLFSEMLRNR